MSSCDELMSTGSTTMSDDTPMSSCSASDPSASEMYLSKADLTPLGDEGAVTAALAAALSDLRNLDDWRQLFEAINIVRRVNEHHREHLTDLDAVCTLVLKHSESLRSGLAKNALMCIPELCSSNSKDVTSQMSKVFTVLLPKTASEKRFIKMEARRAVDEVVASCPSEQTVLALCDCANDRNADVCAVAAGCIETCLTFMQAENQSTLQANASKIMTCLSGLLEGRLAETKSCAKRIVALLSRSWGVETVRQHAQCLATDRQRRCMMANLPAASAQTAAGAKAASGGFRAFLKQKQGSDVGSVVTVKARDNRDNTPAPSNTVA